MATTSPTASRAGWRLFSGRSSAPVTAAPDIRSLLNTRAEVVRPIAVPIIGGMLSSLLHVLIVTPVIFVRLRGRDIRGIGRPDARIR